MAFWTFTVALGHTQKPPQNYSPIPFFYLWLQATRFTVCGPKPHTFLRVLNRLVFGCCVQPQCGSRPQTILYVLFVATGHTIVIFTRQFLTLLLNKSCRAVVQPEYREYAFHILQFVAPSPILSLWLAATGAALGNKTLLFRHWVSMWLQTPNYILLLCVAIGHNITIYMQQFFKSVFNKSCSVVVQHANCQARRREFEPSDLL